MKVYGVTESQIYDAAESVGVRVYNFREHPGRKPYVNFTLKTSTDATEPRTDWRGRRVMRPKYQRTSTYGKHSHAKGFESVTYHSTVPGAVCWHGHRDMLRALFALAPNAEVRTAMATYSGAAHFEATYRATASGGGSYMGMNQMVPYEQACTCGEDEHE
jgi:hypothetical protein